MEFHLTEAEREAHYKRMEAQARLVAAAPDLLAALKRLVDEAARNHDSYAAWEQARAAITKATAP